MNQKNIILVIVIILFAGAAGYFALMKKSPEVAQQINTPTLTPKDETAGWQSHSNIGIGFSFRYPQTWKIEDDLKMDTCCLNLFNRMSPYQGDFLKQNVMKAQFQYDIDIAISNKQQYVDSLVKGSTESEMGDPIDKSSIVSIQNENGLDILKFSGGIGDIGYVIPRKANFSEVIYIIVWNPDSTIEKVLMTLKLTK